MNLEREAPRSNTKEINCLFCKNGVLLTIGETKESGEYVKQPYCLTEYGYIIPNKFNYCPICGRKFLKGDDKNG